MKLETVTWGHPILRRYAKEVTCFDRSLRFLMDEMVVHMYASKGVGLAAPQVGHSIRAVVVDPYDGERPDSLYKMVNPTILHTEGESVADEGCLSIPGMSVKVKRAQKIMVRYQSPEGETLSLEARDWFARIIQHEIDHLEGVLMVDYMNPVERKIWSQKLGITGE